jgi:hypothetical protein
MAALDRCFAGALAALLTAAGAGCAAGSRGGEGVREPLPPQTTIQPTATELPPQPATPVDELAGGPSPAAPAAGAADPTLIVIDSAEASGGVAPSLAEAARRERARRDRQSAAPVAVITNQNLADQAKGGVLTIAHGDTDGEAALDDEAEAVVAKAAEEEKVWRQRGLEIRKRWREAADSIPALEARIAELRQRFYAEDDPAYRDGEIKPQWDRALAELDEARARVARGAEEVAQFLEEGRRAGALPGWLREGAELEPEPVLEQVEGPAAHEPQEPSIYEPPPGD